MDKQIRCPKLTGFMVQVMSSLQIIEHVTTLNLLFIYFLLRGHLSIVIVPQQEKH